MGKSTELVVASDYDIFQSEDLAIMGEVMVENLTGVDLRPNDLEVIKFPSGGSLAWEVEGEDGEPDYVKEFGGVILHVQGARAYWEQDIDEGGGGTPPDCFSRDGIEGEGTVAATLEKPLCKLCPMSKFDDTREDRRPPCKELKLVFLLRPGRMLPSVLRVPPTSLAVIRKYMRQLVSISRPRTGTVTTFGLEKAENANGIEYARLTCATSKDQKLTDEQRAVVRQYIEAISNVIDEFSSEADNLAGAAEEAA